MLFRASPCSTPQALRPAHLFWSDREPRVPHLLEAQCPSSWSWAGRAYPRIPALESSSVLDRPPLLLQWFEPVRPGIHCWPLKGDQSHQRRQRGPSESRVGGGEKWVWGFPHISRISLHLVIEGSISVLDASLRAGFATTMKVAISIVPSFFSRCRIIGCIHWLNRSRTSAS